QGPGLAPHLDHARTTQQALDRFRRAPHRRGGPRICLAAPNPPAQVCPLGLRQPPPLSHPGPPPYELGSYSVRRVRCDDRLRPPTEFGQRAPDWAVSVLPPRHAASRLFLLEAGCYGELPSVQ